MGAVEKGLPSHAPLIINFSSIAEYIFMQKHEKLYSSDVEEQNRHEIWEANKKLIDFHNQNADRYGFTMEMNMFGDLVSTKQ